MDISKSSSAQYKVDEKKYRENYERIYKSKEPKEKKTVCKKDLEGQQ
jgi:hypothetical protein